MIDLFQRLGAAGQVRRRVEPRARRGRALRFPGARHRPGPPRRRGRLPRHPRPHGRPPAPHPRAHRPAPRASPPGCSTAGAVAVGVELLDGDDTVLVDTTDVARVPPRVAAVARERRRAPLRGRRRSTTTSRASSATWWGPMTVTHRRSSAAARRARARSYLLMLRTQVTRARRASAWSRSASSASSSGFAIGASDARATRSTRAPSFVNALRALADGAGRRARVRLVGVRRPRRRRHARLPVAAPGRAGGRSWSPPSLAVVHRHLPAGAWCPLVIAAAAHRGGRRRWSSPPWSPRPSAMIAYTGVFVALGLRVQRALVWGLLYIFIWEGFVAHGQPPPPRSPIRAYGRSILADITDVRPARWPTSPRPWRSVAGPPSAAVAAARTPCGGCTAKTWREPPFRAAIPHDREILRLALPALGALVAEPLYILTDTAVVGRIGTERARGPGRRQQHPAHRLLALHLPGLRHHRRGGPPDRRRRASAEAAHQAVQGMWLAVLRRRRCSPLLGLRVRRCRWSRCSAPRARSRRTRSSTCASACSGVPAAARGAGRHRLPARACRTRRRRWSSRSLSALGQPRARGGPDLRARVRHRRVGAVHRGRPVRRGGRSTSCGCAGAVREHDGGARPPRADASAAGAWSAATCSCARSRCGASFAGVDRGRGPDRHGDAGRPPDRLRDLELPRPDASTPSPSPGRR